MDCLPHLHVATDHAEAGYNDTPALKSCGIPTVNGFKRYHGKEQLDAYRAACLAVKAKYPKP